MMLFRRLNEAIEQKNYRAIYDVLADSNMDINRTGRCDLTPLLLAIEQGDEQITELFLQMGANPNVPNQTDKANYPLEMAIQKACDMPEKTDQYVKIIECLLKHDARAIQDTQTEWALHQAAESGNLEIIRLLIQYGFNPYKQNLHDKTPYEIALIHEHEECASFLKPSELDESFPFGRGNETLYSNCVLIGKAGIRILRQSIPSELVKKIMSFCFSDYNQGKFGGRDEGIVHAVRTNDLAGLDAAFLAGFILNDQKVCTFSHTPLVLAGKQNNTAMVKRLLEVGGSILSEHGFYPSIKHPEIRGMLLTEKRKQMETFKKGALKKELSPRCVLIDRAGIKIFGQPIPSELVAYIALFSSDLNLLDVDPTTLQLESDGEGEERQRAVVDAELTIRQLEPIEEPITSSPQCVVQ
jgi:ankyrin repeat protein